jgi:hypothetical protein
MFRIVKARGYIKKRTHIIRGCTELALPDKPPDMLKAKKNHPHHIIILLLLP